MCNMLGSVLFGPQRSGLALPRSTYRVGSLSENVAGMLLKKDVCGRTDDEEDDEEEGFEEEEGEEEDGAGDTAEAVVVAVLTLGRISWQKGDVRLLKLS